MTVLESEPLARAVTCCGLATSPITPIEADRLAPMFKALGDPVRLRMVSMIAARPELCVCEITPAFELSSGIAVAYQALHRYPEALEALSALLG
jgi:ArsR family transcriptional regulator